MTNVLLLTTIGGVMDYNYDNYHLDNLQAVLQLEDILSDAKEQYIIESSKPFSLGYFQTAYRYSYRNAYKVLKSSRSLHEYICEKDTPILFEILTLVLNNKPLTLV